MGLREMEVQMASYCPSTWLAVVYTTCKSQPHVLSFSARSSHVSPSSAYFSCATRPFLIRKSQRVHYSRQIRRYSTVLAPNRHRIFRPRQSLFFLSRCWADASSSGSHPLRVPHQVVASPMAACTIPAGRVRLAETSPSPTLKVLPRGP